MRRLLLLLATAAGAAGAGPALARPCGGQELIGTWELVSIKAAEGGVQAFYGAAPREYLKIGADLSFAYIATSRAQSLRDAEAAITSSDATDGVDYRVVLRPDSRLLVLRDERLFQGFACSMAEEAGDGGAATGDMIWTELPGMPAVRRVQRRLSAAPAAPSWRLLLSSAKNLWLLDSQSISRSGDTVGYAQLVAEPVFRDASRQPVDDVSYVVSRIEVNCSTRQIRGVATDLFDAGSQLLRGMAFVGPWGPADAELDAPLAFVCDGKPLPDATVTNVPDEMRRWRAALPPPSTQLPR